MVDYIVFQNLKHFLTEKFSIDFSKIILKPIWLLGLLDLPYLNYKIIHNVIRFMSMMPINFDFFNVEV